MRIVINSLLFLLILGLIYVLYSSIADPIKFRVEKQKRERAVIDKLVEIREAQAMYFDITGRYASSFDSLKHVLETGQFISIKIEGDPDDPNFEDFDRDTTYYAAIDSVKSLGLDLAAMPDVPYGEGAKFEIFADTIRDEGSLANVVEVGTLYKSFMGEFASRKYAMYDDRYDPNKFLKFGDKSKAVLTGNWEQ